MLRRFFLLVMCVVLAVSFMIQTGLGVENISLPIASKPPVLDGVDDDSCWLDSPIFEGQYLNSSTGNPGIAIQPSSNNTRRPSG